VDGKSLSVRLWRPYGFVINILDEGSYRLRIRVTNTLGSYYEVGKRTTMVGFHPVTTTTGSEEEPA
jgi:hypothetical protein